ncbi:hypothetical protein [Aliagarivorans marinus]|uniref:hypothetical protein n=1 Tax=Aliagarivorans marinus TaxID=561965 RepID=UPI00040B33F2|nr:hypothetical protein [Aliagarivorans marinus]
MSSPFLGPLPHALIGKFAPSLLLLGLLTGCTSQYQPSELEFYKGLLVKKRGLEEGYVAPITGWVNTYTDEYARLDWYKDGALRHRTDTQHGGRKLIDQRLDATGLRNGYSFFEAIGGMSGYEGDYVHGVLHGDLRLWDEHNGEYFSSDWSFYFGANPGSDEVLRLLIPELVTIPERSQLGADALVLPENFDFDVQHSEITTDYSGWIRHQAKNGYYYRGEVVDGQLVSRWDYDENGILIELQRRLTNGNLRSCTFTKGTLQLCSQHDRGGLLHGRQIALLDNDARYSVVDYQNGVLQGAAMRFRCASGCELLPSNGPANYLHGVDLRDLNILQRVIPLETHWLDFTVASGDVRHFNALADIPKGFDGVARVYDSEGYLTYQALYKRGARLSLWQYNGGMLSAYSERANDGSTLEVKLIQGRVSYFEQLDANGNNHGRLMRRQTTAEGEVLHHVKFFEGAQYANVEVFVRDNTHWIAERCIQEELNFGGVRCSGNQSPQLDDSPSNG